MAPAPGALRHSRVVEIPLVVRVAAAAMLLGCGADHRMEAQRCVGEGWVVVPDERCAEGTPPPGNIYGGGYRWYYGGAGMRPGERVSGGSVIPPATAQVVRPNSGGVQAFAPGGVSQRGGFGSTGDGTTVSS